MEMKVIDVSAHQAKIDWSIAKNHIDGAIIRCGYGQDAKNQDDIRFKENVEACIKYGIPFGVYIYSYARNVNMTKGEAAHVLRLLEPYKDKISFPVYLDLEEIGTEGTAVARAKIFGEIIEANGYMCGIYANQNWWQNFLKDNLNQYTKWVAKYSNTKPVGISGTYDMWQYSSKGVIPGIKGFVDMNICYRDFPAEINGKPAPEKPAKKSNEEIADEVIAGKWSVGVYRKERLTNAGYDYKAIQAIVNEKLQDKGFVKYYIVKSGDSLTKIASKFGTTYKKLAELNGIANPNKIYVGQKIRVN